MGGRIDEEILLIKAEKLIALNIINGCFTKHLLS